MQVFNIHHLDHYNEQYAEQIKELISTRPILDESIISLYTGTRAHELEVRDNHHEVSQGEFIKTKCAIVRKLLETNAYQYVADLKVRNIIDVWKMTNSINGYWFMQKNKNLTFKNLSERDTRSYDVVTCGDDIYLINGVGFIDVNNECIFKCKA
jgi:hypothetical protein|tara:strand:- start:1259 stop:1720 length:462 start_codon:yes stop_codon:yes gene_type:complete